MPRRPLIILLSIACLVGAPASAVEASPATRVDADGHYEAAAELYAREDFAGAAAEFAIAYALAPRVDTLFAWAQAERLAGHYDEALKLYERLLDGELSKAQRKAIETLRFQVQGELVIAPPEPEPEPEAPEQPAPTEQAPVDDGAPSRRGVGLIGVGAGMTALAGGLLIGGGVVDNRVRRAQTYEEFEAAYDPKTGRGRGAIGLYASGGMLMAAGLTTLIVGAVRLRRSKRSSTQSANRPPVALVPSLGRDHVGVVLTIGSWP
jgi:tetratricopeptide (TPR) repeat protein